MNNKHPRRMLLRGAGATLALPWLSSLEPFALGDASSPTPKRFVAFITEHGAVQFANMFPAQSTLTERKTLLPGYDIRWGKLQRTVQGTTAQVSPVLRGSATSLSDRLVGKMNVLRGLDIPFYISHHFGGHLGNYAANRSENGAWGPARPTIDQLMAWSPSFYPSLAGIKQRSLYTGMDTPGNSWVWSNPAARTGPIQPVERVPSPQRLFDSVITSGKPAATPATRAPIVDRVLENYRRLRDGNRRLSADDRRRLDDHMQRIAELQRKLAAASAAGGRSCTSPQRPSDDTAALARPDDWPRFAPLVNDVIAAAFACDATRIAVVNGGPGFTDGFAGNWHQGTAHVGDAPDAQARLVKAHGAVFEAGLLDLAAKLDVAEANGSTCLDGSLLCWVQESGRFTHASDSIPVVTFGGAGGAIKTGWMCDYRNQVPTSQIHLSDHSPSADRYVGLTYNRWLATVLNAMGIPKSEWEDPNNRGRGYGNVYLSDDFLWEGKSLYVPGVVESASDPLPVIA